MIKDLKRGQAHTSESTHGLFSCHDAPLKPGGAISVYVRKRNKHSVCVCVLCVCLSCPFLLHTTSVSKLDVFTPSTTSKPPVSLKMRRPLFFFWVLFWSVFLKWSTDEQSGRRWIKCLFEIKGPKTRGRNGRELVVRNKWRKEWADEGEYEKNNKIK